MKIKKKRNITMNSPKAPDERSISMDIYFIRRARFVYNFFFFLDTEVKSAPVSRKFSIFSLIHNIFLSDIFKFIKAFNA